MFDIFLIFAQNIDCGYMLDPPRHNQCFGAKRREIGISLHFPVLLYKKWGIRGYVLHGHVILINDFFYFPVRDIISFICKNRVHKNGLTIL